MSEEGSRGKKKGGLELLRHGGAASGRRAGGCSWPLRTSERRREKREKEKREKEKREKKLLKNEKTGPLALI